MTRTTPRHEAPAGDPVDAGSPWYSVGGTATGEDEAALVPAARAQPQAFAVLYQRYLARIYRYLRTRVAGEDDAADLTQQVFLKALDALPACREGDGPLAAWLFAIARNAATDYHRRHRGSVAWDRLPEALHPADATVGANPESAALQREALTRLHALLRQLDAGKRELLALRFAAGLTAREIAALVGKSEAAVK